MLPVQAPTKVPIELRIVAKGGLAVQRASLQAEHRRGAGDPIERPDVLGWIEISWRDLLRAQQYQNVWIHQRVTLTIEQVDHILAIEKPGETALLPVLPP